MAYVFLGPPKLGHIMRLVFLGGVEVIADFGNKRSAGMSHAGWNIPFRGLRYVPFGPGRGSPQGGPVGPF